MHNVHVVDKKTKELIKINNRPVPQGLAAFLACQTKRELRAEKMSGSFSGCVRRDWQLESRSHKIIVSET